MSFTGNWPDNHIDALKVNFAAGMSFAQNAAAINAQFQTDYSRNATIGKAKRIGLTQADKPQSSAPKPRKAGPWVDRNSKPQRMNGKRRPAEQQFTRGLRQADVVPLLVSLLDLEPERCRWPYGDGPFVFCGCHTFDGSFYCEPHAALSVGEGTISERNALRIRRAA